ncbi:MAG: hypothetical protein WD000_00350 [Thermodesulfobacteriota bacterium]
MNQLRKDISFKYTADAIKNISESFEDKTKSENRLIENLMLLQATIVGFSAAFLNLSIESSGHVLWLKLSISIMVLNIFLGAMIILARYEQKAHAKYVASIFKANQDALDEMVSKGVFSKESEEYQGKVVANLVEMKTNAPHLKDEKIFSKYANELHKQWKDDLPHSVLIKGVEDSKLPKWNNPTFLWFINRSTSLSDCFFVLVPISFLFLVISLL